MHRNDYFQGVGTLILILVWSLTHVPLVRATESSVQVAVTLSDPDWRHPCINSSAEFRVNGDVAPTAYLATVLIIDDAGESPIVAVRFGIDYDISQSNGVTIFQWHGCGDREIASVGWPAPKRVITVIWDHDRAPEPGSAWSLPGKRVRVAGFFYCAAEGEGSLSVRGLSQSDDIEFLRADGTSSRAPRSQTGALRSKLRSGSVPPKHARAGYVAFSRNARDLGYNPVRELQQIASAPAVRSSGGSQWRLVSVWNRQEAKATIAISVGDACRISIRAFDVTGREVSKIVEDRSVQPGNHDYTWDGTGRTGAAVACGMYFVRATLEGRSLTSRIVVVR